MGDAIEQFGVHNVYLNRVIYVIHTKMAEAKNRNDCYHTLTVLHQQLGDGWTDVLTSPLSKAAKRTVLKKFEKNKQKPPAHVADQKEEVPQEPEPEKELTPEPEPEPTPPPPPGPLHSDQGGVKYRYETHDFFLCFS